MAVSIQIQPGLIPQEVGKRIFASTLEAMRRVQTEQPDVWARIEARAAQLKTERMKLDEGK